eukprot:TRINITY_DN40604_c0_g1_i2.p1 TRINITY_DN40604_c0_g1~~TRINITY_DN40604_c0_g1_i2.p1  ORF type:complete len:355 (+),score=91.94 TRINITY_DN40604_c0_g1_i2:93-1157(+)
MAAHAEAAAAPGTQAAAVEATSCVLWEEHAHNHDLIRGSPVHHALRQPGHEHRGERITVRYDAPEGLEALRWRVFRQDPALGEMDPGRVGPDAPPDARDRLHVTVDLGRERPAELPLFCFLVQLVDPLSLLPPDDSDSDAGGAAVPAGPGAAGGGASKPPLQGELAQVFSDGTWTGALVWDAALLCAELLLSDQQLRSSCEGGGTVVELGCGLGVPGLVAALLGARAVLTDRGPLARLAVENIERCGLGARAAARTLDWCDGGVAVLRAEVGDPDLVLACDCVFFPLFGSAAPLVGVLEGLAGPRTRCIVASERRPSDGLDRFRAGVAARFETLRSWALAGGGVEVLELRLREE